MKNEMTWDKNGLLIPNGELIERRSVCPDDAQPSAAYAS